MIIEALLNLVIRLFMALLSFVNIPEIPQETISNVQNTLNTIIEKGSALIDLLIPYNVAKGLLLIVIGIEVAIPIYHFAMWLLKKIPMLSIR